MNRMNTAQKLWGLSTTLALKFALTNDEIHEWLSIRVMGTDETQLQLGYRVLFGCKSKLSRLQMEIVQDWAVARRLEMENFEAWLKE